MSHFSGALLLSDVDDFIQPSQACVKPIFKNYANSGHANSNQSKKRGVIELETADESNLQISTIATTTEDPASTAKIKLTDCLACSGCITTAESVLISEQSSAEFRNALKSRTGDQAQPLRDFVVVSVSPASRASLAVQTNSSLTKAQQLISEYMHGLGVSVVTDVGLARDIMLLEMRSEFLERWRSGGKFPILSSLCPGWICYAEKSVGGYVLPYISTVKSPQQIMGSIVKYSCDQAKQTTPGRVYHATVMPCFDKKLEASREDFEIDGVRDVDIVLSTKEVLDMMTEDNFAFSLSDDSPIRPANKELANFEGDELFGTQGSSGGHVENILPFVARELFGETGHMVERRGRNADFKEFAWVVDGKEVLLFAKAYGFRNLQTLMRNIKAQKCAYHFVEIMACPSGCVNGGGQIRAATPQQGRELVKLVETKYHEINIRDPSSNASAVSFRKQLLQITSTNEQGATVNALHTQYHERDKIQNPLTIKW